MCRAFFVPQEKSPMRCTGLFVISRQQLSYLKICRRITASFRRDFVGNLLTFVQAAKTCALDSADVNENVRTAVVRLDETETFLRVEPLNCTLSHLGLLVETHSSCMKFCLATIALQVIRKQRRLEKARKG